MLVSLLLLLLLMLPLPLPLLLLPHREKRQNHWQGFRSRSSRLHQQRKGTGAAAARGQLWWQGNSSNKKTIGAAMTATAAASSVRKLFCRSNHPSSSSSSSSSSPSFSPPPPPATASISTRPLVYQPLYLSKYLHSIYRVPVMMSYFGSLLLLKSFRKSMLSRNQVSDDVLRAPCSRPNIIIQFYEHRPLARYEYYGRFVTTEVRGWLQ